MGEGEKARMTSGRLAKLFNVSANSIKNWSDQWEKDGTITPVPRTPGGHRIYGPEHVQVFRNKLTGPAPLPPPAPQAFV